MVMESMLSTDADTSDEELMRQLAGGRREAIGPLHARYASLIYGLAARSLDRVDRRGDQPGGLPRRLAACRELRPGAGYVPRLGLADHPLERAQ